MHVSKKNQLHSCAEPLMVLRNFVLQNIQGTVQFRSLLGTILKNTCTTLVSNPKPSTSRYISYIQNSSEKSGTYLIFEIFRNPKINQELPNRR